MQSTNHEMKAAEGSNIGANRDCLCKIARPCRLCSVSLSLKMYDVSRCDVQWKVAIFEFGTPAIDTRKEPTKIEQKQSKTKTS